MAEPATLPNLSLDTRAFEPRHRLDAWREFFADVLDYRVRSSAEPTVRNNVRLWRAGSLVLGHYRYGASTTRALRNDSFNDRIVLRMFLRGGSWGQLGDRDVRMSGGAVHIHRRDGRQHFVSDGGEKLVVSLPYDAIGYDASPNSPYIAHSVATSLGRILKSTTETLFDTIANAGAGDIDALASGYTSMLRAIIAPDLRDETARHHFEEKRADTLLRYVEENLQDPNLSIGQICGALGISRTTLYRVFAEHGGVARYILKRRLDRAYDELAHGTPQRGLIGTVALRWAFPDAAQFTRQFRAQFGCRPSDVAGSALSAAELAGASSERAPDRRSLCSSRYAGIWN